MILTYIQTTYRPVLTASNKWNDVIRGIAEREVNWEVFAWLWSSIHERRSPVSLGSVSLRAGDHVEQFPGAMGRGSS